LGRELQLLTEPGQFRLRRDQVISNVSFGGRCLGLRKSRARRPALAKRGDLLALSLAITSVAEAAIARKSFPNRPLSRLIRSSTIKGLGMSGNQNDDRPAVKEPRAV
jgi:hypothetical protein